MLEQLRNASKTWVAAILIGMLVISFAIFGINDIFSRSHSTTLVTVGGVEIDGREFDNEFLRRSKRQRMPDGRPMTPTEARAAGFDRVVLNDMIADSAVLQEAQRLGLTASDAMVREAIKSIPAFLGPTGEIDPQALGSALQELGMSEPQFVEQMRADLTRQQLLQTAMIGAPASRGLAELMQAYANERRTVEYVVLPAEKAGAIPPPDDATLKAFIDADPKAWTAPETRAVTILAVGPKDLMAGIEIPEGDIKAAYEAQNEKFVTPETRELQQIVFPTKEEAEAARKAIDGGKSFEEVATERKLKPEDIALGTITKGDTTVPEGAFEVAEGEVSQALEGPFGWTLIKIVKVTPGTTKTYEEVKQSLRDELAMEQAIDKVFPFEDQIEDARAAGSTFEEIAKELKIPLKAIPAIDAEGRDPSGKPVEGIPDGETFLGDVFQTEPGEQSDINQTPEHVIYVVRVDSATPSAVKPIDQIRDVVTAEWLKAEEAKRLKAIGDELAARASTANMSLEDVAKELGLPGKASEPLSRDKPGDDLSVAFVDKLFGAAKGTWLAGDGAVSPQIVVARVKDITTSSTAADPLDEERQYRTQATRELADEMAVAYRNAIVAATKVEINEDLFNTARNRSQ